LSENVFETNELVLLSFSFYVNIIWTLKTQLEVHTACLHKTVIKKYKKSCCWAAYFKQFMPWNVLILLIKESPLSNFQFYHLNSILWHTGLFDISLMAWVKWKAKVEYLACGMRAVILYWFLSYGCAWDTAVFKIFKLWYA